MVAFSDAAFRIEPEDMNMKRKIYLPALSMSVGMDDFTKAIRYAKAHPKTVFHHGLTTWRRTSGAEIVKQFRDGVHERISQGIVEAFLRLQYGTLDHLDRETFACEIALETLCIDEDPEGARVLALSYAL